MASEEQRSILTLDLDKSIKNIFSFLLINQSRKYT